MARPKLNEALLADPNVQRAMSMVAHGQRSQTALLSELVGMGYARVEVAPILAAVYARTHPDAPVHDSPTGALELALTGAGQLCGGLLLTGFAIGLVLLIGGGPVMIATGLIGRGLGNLGRSVEVIVSRA